MEFHGLIPIDKPLGWTSHDVVARLRRVLNTRRIGHAGTLDPAATGVLVVGVGRATRFLDTIQASSKEYIAHIVLGVESVTADIDGRLQESSNDRQQPSGKAIEGVLLRFVGDIQQIPPKYSAIKHEGETLYRRARRGESVEVAARNVSIYLIEVIGYNYPDLVLRINCGSGVYIRSLARDVGDALGCGAYLHHLVRSRIGEIRLHDCWKLDELSSHSFPRSWATVATGVDLGATHLPAFRLAREDRHAWYHGRSTGTGVSRVRAVSDVRVYTAEGHFAGLGTLFNSGSEEATIRPRIVLPEK